MRNKMYRFQFFKQIGLGWFFTTSLLIQLQAQDFNVAPPVFNGINNPFIISEQETSPTGVTFSNDGLRMFVIGAVIDQVHQYDLTTAFDVATASFTPAVNNPFIVTEQEGAAYAVTFSNDGMRMFITGFSDEVNQYELITAFDITTASFNETVNNPFDISDQETMPTGISFSNDGLRMFITGQLGKEVNQYDLTASFDITTASFTPATNNPFDVSNEEFTPSDVTFSNDGFRMFIIGSNGDEVNQYDLSTAFDITSASFNTVTNNPFDVSTKEINPHGLAFSTDGSMMFIIGQSQDDINQYELSTAFDVTTASFLSDGNPFDVSSQNTSPKDVAFSNDGLRMFVVGTGVGAVIQYDLGNAFDLTTANFTSTTNNPFDISTENINPNSISFSENGLRMFIVDHGEDEVNQYDLSTAFDITTASFTPTVNNPLNVNTEEERPTGITFSNDGLRMFIVGWDQDEVNQYELTAAFDITTSSFTASTNNPFDVSGQETSPQDVSFSQDGLRMYVIGSAINEYNLSTAFDITTASFTATDLNPFDFSLLTSDATGISFSSNEDHMFIVSDNNLALYQYDLMTLIGWDGSESADWNTAGNWDIGVIPNNLDNVTISNSGFAPVVSNDDIAVVNDLTIDASASLTVASGGTLAIMGSVTNNGTYTVERNVNGGTGAVNSAKYSVIGSPVSDATVVSLTDADFIYAYENSLAAYEAPASTDPLRAGQGFFVGHDEASPVISLLGTPNFGDIIYGVSETSGFELVANPYAAPISIASFIADNSIVNGAVYLWDDGGSNVGSSRGGDYITTNGLGSATAVQPNGVDDGVAGQEGTTGADNGNITSVQGFFVEVTNSGNIVFSPDQQVTATGANADANHYRLTEEQGAYQKVKLAIEGNGLYNEVLVGLGAKATLGIDRELDAKKFVTDNPLSFYSLIAEEKYAIQGLPLFADSPVSTSLGFDLSESGSYTMSVVDTENLPDELSISLLDHVTGIAYDLKEVNSFSFHSEVVSDDQRFELTFGSSSVLGVLKEFSELSISKIEEGLGLSYEVSDGNYPVAVYNLTGQVVFNDEVSFIHNEASVQVQLKQNQIYILKVNAASLKFSIR